MGGAGPEPACKSAPFTGRGQHRGQHRTGAADLKAVNEKGVTHGVTQRGAVASEKTAPD
jgi:hypothetical protein